MTEESIWRPDVTVATVVQRDGHWLVVEESVRGDLVINQPAGHLEPGETLIDAARRETLEETAWDVRLSALIGVYQWVNPRLDRHFVRFAFAADAVMHHPELALDAGIVRVLWLSRDDLANGSYRLRSPMILKSIDDYLAGQRLPLSAICSLLPDRAAMVF